MAAILEAPERIAALDQLKTKLAKADADITRCDAQITTAKTDAEAAYQSRDTATLGKLFARIEALERQRADYCNDWDATAAALCNLVRPQIEEIAAEEHEQATGWQQAADAALASAVEHALALAAAMDALQAVPSYDAFRGHVAEWQARLAAVQATVPVDLALPALPDPVQMHSHQYRRVVDLVKPIAEERRRPAFVWG